MIRRVESTEKDNRELGSFEFKWKDKDGNYLLILKSKKILVIKLNGLEIYK